MIRCIFPVIIFIIASDIRAQLPSFSKNNLDVFYQGMDNIIAIDLNGSKGELANCKVSNSQRVSKYSDSLYAVYPSGSESFCLVKLYYRNIIVEQLQMKIAPPLELKVILENEKDGAIRKTDLVYTNSFHLGSVGGTPIPKHGFRLISGNISVINAGGQLLYSGNIKESVFSEPFKNIIKELTAGCKLTLSNPRIVNQLNQHVNAQAYTEWKIIEN